MPRWAREAMTTAVALLSCSELSKVFLSAALSPRAPRRCEEASYRPALFSSLWVACTGRAALADLIVIMMISNN